MKILDDYLKLQKEIYDYFGYENIYPGYPIDDSTMYIWFIHDNNIFYSNRDILDAIKTDKEYYMGTVTEMTYQRDGYTMVVLDKQYGGGNYLSIFDDNKNVLLTIQEKEMLENFY